MRTAAALLLCLMLCLAQAAASPLVQDDMLESALSMLEAGNPILLRYNRMTGRDVQARFSLGCPYLWGGKSERKLLDVFLTGQSSPGYYVKGRSYLYGFDCSGFVQWLVFTHGCPVLRSISQALDRRGQETDIPGSEDARGADLSALLEPGDLLAIQHDADSYHIAMYIGTLAMYGYERETLPEPLRDSLESPLVIHCTVSSDYYIRYEEYIEDTFDWRIYPPDGGVIVSVLAPEDAAPFREMNPDNEITRYFDLEGYKLQVYDSASDLRFRWMRWKNLKRP